jgi:hypothetical protein
LGSGSGFGFGFGFGVRVRIRVGVRVGDLVRRGECLGQPRGLRVEETRRRERRLAGGAAPLRSQAEVAEARRRHELRLEIADLVEEIGAQQVVAARRGLGLVEEVERVPRQRLRLGLVGARRKVRARVRVRVSARLRVEG